MQQFKFMAWSFHRLLAIGSASALAVSLCACTGLDFEVLGGIIDLSVIVLVTDLLAEKLK